MSRRFPIRLLGVTLSASLLVVAGCAHRPGEQRPAPKVDRKAELNATLTEVRQHAWQTALEITELYEHIGAERCPGVAALVKDVRATQAIVQVNGLDAIRTDELVTYNPHFWRAALEIAPTDGSFLLLHATLLASGGEIWRANRILVATTQVLPIPAAMRPFYLAHTYGIGTFLLNSVQQSLPPPSSPAARREEALRHALQDWPGNAVILSELIDERIREKVTSESGGLRRPNRERIQKMVDDVLADSKADIARLFAIDPVGAAVYRGDSQSRREGRNIRAMWTRMSDSDVALGHKEIAELANSLERVDAFELALVIQRMQVTARGFPAPGDEVFWRRVLSKLLGPSAAVAFWADIDRREVNVVELNQNAADEVWKGDPAVNPLVMQAVEREIAEHTFEIDILHDNPEAQARAYRARGIQESRAGMDQAAIEDFEAAIKLTAPSPLILVDKAVALVALGRDADAETLFAEIRSTPGGKELSLHEYGLFRYGQGRYDEAREAFAEEYRRHRDEPYAAIMAELAARRSGDARPGIAARAQRPPINDPWPGHCLTFLAGKMNEEDLLRNAHQGGNLVMMEHLCEADFILSQTSLAAGDTARGLELLESCIRTGVTGFVEFRMARIELRRLAPEREARSRNVEEVPVAPPGEPKSPPHLRDKKPAEEELLDDTAPA